MCRVMLHPPEDIIKQRGREAKGVGNFCVQAQKTKKKSGWGVTNSKRAS